MISTELDIRKFRNKCNNERSKHGIDHKLTFSYYDNIDFCLTERQILDEGRKVEELIKLLVDLLKERGIKTGRRVGREGEPIKNTGSCLLRHRRFEVGIAENGVVYFIKPATPDHGWFWYYKFAYDYKGKYEEAQ